MASARKCAAELLRCRKDERWEARYLEAAEDEEKGEGMDNGYLLSLSDS